MLDPGQQPVFIEELSTVFLPVQGEGSSTQKQTFVRIPEERRRHDAHTHETRLTGMVTERGKVIHPCGRNYGSTKKSRLTVHTMSRGLCGEGHIEGEF